jgi:hypothetical protein
VTGFCRVIAVIVLLGACRNHEGGDEAYDHALAEYAPGVRLGMEAHRLTSRYNLKIGDAGYYDLEFRTRDMFRTLSVGTDPRPRRGELPVSARVSAVSMLSHHDSSGPHAKSFLTSVLGAPRVRCLNPIDKGIVLDSGPTDVYYWSGSSGRAVSLMAPVLPSDRRGSMEIVRLTFWADLDSTEFVRLDPGPCLRDGRAPSPPSDVSSHVRHN